MQSKKIIICPECKKKKSQTKQHIIPKRYGMTLKGRNKKLECEECQKFFDNTTIKEAISMAQSDKLLPDKEIEFNKKYYFVENSKQIIGVGNTYVLSTGSPIQAISVEAVNQLHHSTGSPVALNFDNFAPQNQDKVKIINNHNQELITYISVIVDKPKNSV